MEVLEGDVPHESGATAGRADCCVIIVRLRDAWREKRRHTGARISSEDLDPGAVLGIEHRDIRDRHIGDDIHFARVLCVDTRRLLYVR